MTENQTNLAEIQKKFNSADAIHPAFSKSDLLLTLFFVKCFFPIDLLSIEWHWWCLYLDLCNMFLKAIGHFVHQSSLSSSIFITSAISTISVSSVNSDSSLSSVSSLNSLSYAISVRSPNYWSNTKLIERAELAQPVGTRTTHRTRSTHRTHCSLNSQN